MKKSGTKELRMGIDVGSTTTKIVVLGEDGEELLLSDYTRHHHSSLRAWNVRFRWRKDNFQIHVFM